VQKTEFEWETVYCVRVLRLIDGVYNNDVYDLNGELIAESIPVANGSTLDYIPIVFFGSDTNTAEYSSIPMYSIAKLNLGHYELDCDSRENLHYAGQGSIQVFTEMDAEEFYKANPNGLQMGSGGFSVFGQGDKVQLTQLQATGANESKQKDYENNIIQIGGQMVQDMPTNKTLGAAEMEFSSSISTLKRIALNVSDGLAVAMRYVNDFLGQSYDNEYKLNTQFFTDDFTAQDFTALLQGYQIRTVPKSVIFEGQRRMGVTDKDDEELEAEIENEVEIPTMSYEQAVSASNADEQAAAAAEAE
jgi:hypothetical protein